MAGGDVDRELAALEGLSSHALRARWSALTGKPVPRVSPALLRLALAWEIQAGVHGGLPRRVTRTLDQLAGGKSDTKAARPGMRLVREWNGALHVVEVGDEGAVMWNGRTWPSLSRVAREITGTRWSGPAFFGLRQGKAA